MQSSPSHVGKLRLCQLVQGTQPEQWRFWRQTLPWRNHSVNENVCGCTHTHTHTLNPVLRHKSCWIAGWRVLCGVDSVWAVAGVRRSVSQKLTVFGSNHDCFVVVFSFFSNCLFWTKTVLSLESDHVSKGWKGCCVFWLQQVVPLLMEHLCCEPPQYKCREWVLATRGEQLAVATCSTHGFVSKLPFNGMC